MPKYRVNVCRTAYGNLDFVVDDAKNPTQAMRIAEREAPNHDFTEHTSEYEAQGCLKLDSNGKAKFDCVSDCKPTPAQQRVSAPAHPVRKPKNRR